MASDEIATRVDNWKRPSSEGAREKTPFFSPFQERSRSFPWERTDQPSLESMENSIPRWTFHQRDGAGHQIGEAGAENAKQVEDSARDGDEDKQVSQTRQEPKHSQRVEDVDSNAKSVSEDDRNRIPDELPRPPLCLQTTYEQLKRLGNLTTAQAIDTTSDMAAKPLSFDQRFTLGRTPEKLPSPEFELISSRCKTNNCRSESPDVEIVDIRKVSKGKSQQLPLGRVKAEPGESILGDEPPPYTPNANPSIATLSYSPPRSGKPSSEPHGPEQSVESISRAPPASNKKWTARSWTASQYADLAQLCESSFPIEQFCSKHNKSPAEVKEVFRAIVQAPILAVSGKGPGAARGGLGEERVKERRRLEKEMLAAGSGHQPRGGRAKQDRSTTNELEHLRKEVGREVISQLEGLGIVKVTKDVRDLAGDSKASTIASLEPTERSAGRGRKGKTIEEATKALQEASFELNKVQKAQERKEKREEKKKRERDSYDSGPAKRSRFA